jgi:hypothetical protein
VIKREDQETVKYISFRIEILRERNKSTVILVIIAANWNHLRIKYLSNVPGMNDIKELQKAVILGTVYILCTVLT